MTREEYVKIQIALHDAMIEAANMNMSDVTYINNQQSMTAARFHEIASNKILALDGLKWEDVRADYKRARLEDMK